MANIGGTAGNDYVHRADDGNVAPSTWTELFSTAGADTVSTGASDDVIFGDDGNDRLVAGTGNDTVDGGNGNDLLFGQDGNDLLTGGAGIDNWDGGAGYDIFRIRTASDISGLAETLSGGADIDMLNFQILNAFGPIDISKATITGIEQIVVVANTDLTATAEQLSGFDTVQGGFGGPIRVILSAAGTADFTGGVVSLIGEFRGTAGNDGFLFTDVADGQLVNGLGGADTLIGGNGIDRFDGGAANDTLSGSLGNDILAGAEGNDTLVGGDGNDSLVGGAGLDSFVGGTGNDTIGFLAVSDVSGLAEAIDGGADLDEMSFLAAGTVDITRAVITGVEGLRLGTNDVVLTPTQLGAFDDLFGGFGADRLILSRAGTTDLTGAEFSLIDEIRGSSGNDVIRLNEVAAGLFVDGRAGNDVLYGGDGIDSLTGGEGVDRLYAMDGDDSITGGQGADTVQGGVGYDVFVIQQVSDISGLAENIQGGSDVDRLDFDVGDAVGAVDLSLAVIGGVEHLAINGNEVTLTADQLGAFITISAGFAADRLILSAPGIVDLTDAQIILVDEIRGSSGADTMILTGVVEGQFLNGAGGNDTLTGGEGNDRVGGGDGNDSLFGGAGSDTMTGGLGADRLNGQAGADTFDFNDVTESPRGGGRDVIGGFVHGQDVIDLRDIDANAEVAGDQAFTFIAATAFNDTPGQLRYAGGILEGDINGDGIADIQVQFSGAPVVTAGDVLL